MRYAEHQKSQGIWTADRVASKSATLLMIGEEMKWTGTNDNIRFVLFCGFHSGMRKKENHS